MAHIDGTLHPMTEVEVARLALFPELVAALELAESKLEAWASCSGSPEPAWSKTARQQARAALAKAEAIEKGAKE